jgi:hypothetical protein
LGIPNYKEDSDRRNPLCFAFGTEAIIPAELGSGSLRVESYKAETNNEGLKLHLDLLQEKRDHAQITMSAY